MPYTQSAHAFQLSVRTGQAEASALSADEDRVIIEKAQRGDTDAFEELVKKYQERSIGIARHFVQEEELARDIAQEAFLRVYRNLHRYDPKHRFYTWFYRIVVHLAIDSVRKLRRPGRECALELTRVAAQRVELEMETREVRGSIRKTLEKIPQSYRLLLVLRDIEGFTSKEIADISGWNHATVRWRLHRARALFRTAWEAAGLMPELL